MSPAPDGVPILGQPRGVQIIEHRVLLPAAVDAHPGGLIATNCDVHLRIIDIPKGTALYLPLSEQGATELVDSILMSLQALR